MNIEKTEAYKRGVRDAEERLARRPAPSRWVSVSVPGEGYADDLGHIKLCTRCHLAAGFCKCEED